MNDTHALIETEARFYADDQQIHFWGVQDREAYLDAILAAIKRYLTPDSELSQEELVA